MKRKNRWPVVLLFFLSPAVAELLSGSAPPVEFFNPFGLLILSALYGSGALLIRELRVRWNKGWPTVLALGAAYGIVEEGLMVKSFFDPNWVDLGLLNSYGRWAGVNWIWSLDLTIYHAVFSIAIPILLVELIFYESRNKRWLGRRGMRFFSFLLTADVLLGTLFLLPYRPPFIPFVLAMLAVLILYRLGKKFPTRFTLPQPICARRPRWLAALGFLAMLAFYIILWIMPELNVPILLTVLVTVWLTGWLLWLVGHYSLGQWWTDRRQLALAIGMLTFFVLLAPLQELNPDALDNKTGMTLIGLAAVIGCVWLWLRVGRRERPESSHRAETRPLQVNAVKN